MRAVLNKIFLKKLGIGKFTLSGLAFLIGFSLVLLALQGYIKIKEYIVPKKNISNYVILNKEVGFANTLFGAKSEFAQAEITDLRKQPFVEDLGVFKSSQFQATAHLGGNLSFYTELFFESVPSQFIDNKPDKFVWTEDDNFLPIIISQDFLNLYNFGYALSKGTPQLSKSTISLVPLTVNIYGPFGRKEFAAKVVGFSERISSILVPDNFLRWANAEIVHTAKSEGSRIIVKLRSDKAHYLDAYLEKHGLKISDEKLRLNKILTAINVVMAALVFIGVAFMVFSLVIVMLNFSLMVAQAREEVSLLLQLGYKAKHLVRHLSFYLLIFMVIVVTLSSVLFVIGNNFLLKFLTENGIESKDFVSSDVVFLGVAFVSISALVSYFSINKLIRRSVD